MATRKRHTQSADDKKYHIDGQTFSRRVGLRRAVFEGTAYCTSGGLHKKDLLKNKWGRIVSRKKHAFESKLIRSGKGRLRVHGFTACKGHFGGIPIQPKESKKQACTRFNNGKKAPEKSNSPEPAPAPAPAPAPRYMTRSRAKV